MLDCLLLTVTLSVTERLTQTCSRVYIAVILYVIQRYLAIRHSWIAYMQGFMLLALTLVEFGIPMPSRNVRSVLISPFRPPWK